MKRGHLLGLAVLAVGVATLAAAVGGRVAAAGSTLSRGPGGWMAARLYLEARGTEVVLHDRDLETAPAEDVLVVTFPWQRLAPEETLAGLQHHLARGGTLVVAFTGDLLGFGELKVLDALGLRMRTLRGDPPLHPLRWREYMKEQWRLRAPGPGSEPVLLAAPARVVEASAQALVLFRAQDGTPAVFVEPRGRGRMVVLPADAFSNARLGGSGNADVLERLRGRLGGRWVFDEFHHGLTAPAAATDPGPRRALELYLLHLVLAYALAVFALARRFGPPWHEPAVTSGSAAGLLTGLGRLHDRLGHHRAAALILVERACELDPRLRLSADLRREADRVDASGLVRLGRAVATAQAATRREP